MLSNQKRQQNIKYIKNRLFTVSQYSTKATVLEYNTNRIDNNCNNLRCHQTANNSYGIRIQCTSSCM